MCPPVSPRHEGEGMSYLHATWMYQLQHGDSLRLCFPCFQAAFLDLQDFLELEGWEGEEWNQDPGPVSLGLGEGGGLGGGLYLDDPDPESVPTEVGPQDAVPLGLGPEDADWTQGLPWRLGGPDPCAHWPSPPLPWQGFVRADLVPGQTMLLELGTSQHGNLADTEDWLLGLQVFSLLGFCEALYLRKMKPCWALATSDPGWKVLLEPAEMCIVQPLDDPEEQDLQHWQLCLLETPPGNHCAELVPAIPALLRKGFTVLSYAPWPHVEEQSGALGVDPSAPEP